ncbi:hypothetical protein NDU88_001817 [Pleurodeles waltl]|uniref:Uncharacterized protein n=1 Tax=Pleurodeles waltl TaxID=8319 RepID=A0AAV7NFD2_PLEWA|nr:hypothetical protein NDU88_001817 [Pleurodeles waltl]
MRRSRATPKRKYNTHRQGMGDCSTPQPKRPGERATNPSANRELEQTGHSRSKRLHRHKPNRSDLKEGTR